MTFKCKFFKVINETKDFLCVEINRDEEFKGKKLSCLTESDTIEFWQFLLDEYGALHQEACDAHPFFPRKFIFRKIVKIS